MSRPSEDELIAKYLAPLAGAAGLGLRDDAALLTPSSGRDLVMTKDLLVAGTHFFADDPPGAIARKALRVNVSDLAAKAARPIGFLLGFALPTDWTEFWLAAFVEGLAEDARDFACPLLGGDTTATQGPLALSITAIGEVEAGRMVPRSGAQDGDHLFVSGTIGDAALGLRLRLADRLDRPWIAALGRSDADALRARYLIPHPRVTLRQALCTHARAAMDVSDGLVGDLETMLALEALSAEIALAHIPLSAAARAAIAIEPRLVEAALTGGDDYEILCAVPSGESIAFQQAAAANGIEVTLIGVAHRGTGPVTILDPNGNALDLSRRKFQHFT